MALTSTDETDLILPLYRGMHETPRFATFLERLRRRTEAEYVGLIIRREADPLSETAEFFAGMDLRGKARALGIGELYTLEGIHRERLRPGRVYAVSEFIDHDPAYKARREASIERLGIVDERVVRVSQEAGISAWLILARGRPCTAADSALLSSLAPYVGVALRSLNAIERQRIEAALSAESLSRSGMGWILFDSAARVLSCDAAARRELHERAGISARVGERLQGIAATTAMRLADAATALAAKGDSPPRTVVLSDHPRIEALLLPADGLADSDLTMPAMLALCRMPRTGAADRADRLAHLFDLPRREAQLAALLADGHSIAEAGEAMGLTLESARTYSKRVYGKLGARGQAELVRRVLESAAALA
jgi:DNA-binding CsgD family transcriptional regulator